MSKHKTDLIKYLNQLQNTGLVEEVGVSVYKPEEAIKCLNINIIKHIQIPFNLLDNERKRGEVLRRSKNKLIDVHVRSIFLQGLFFKPYSDFNDKLQPLMRYLKDMQHIAKIANNCSRI